MRLPWRAGIVFPLCIVLFVSCSREKSPETKGGEDGSALGNAAPEVIAADILPPSPGRDTPLSIQYSGQDREQDALQYSFRWYVDDELMQEGESNKMEPGSYRKGSRVYAEVIPSDSFSTGKPFRTPSVTIKNQAPVISNIAFEPVPAFVGSVMTATPEGSDADGDDITYVYRWKVNGKAVTEPQAGNTFDTSKLRKRDVISVTVTPSDNETKGNSIESGGVTLSNAAPQITSSPPQGFKGREYTYTVTARDAEGDPLTYRLLGSPPGMTINPSTGKISWTAPAAVETKEEILIRISVDDGDGGIAEQAFTLVLELK